MPLTPSPNQESPNVYDYGFSSTLLRGAMSTTSLEEVGTAPTTTTSPGSVAPGTAPTAGTSPLTGSVNVLGELNGGSINVPAKNGEQNSFHTDQTGTSWWGCTWDEFKADHANADAYILNTGEAHFSNVVIAGPISATSGTIGGFTISATTLAGGTTNIILDSSNKAISINSATYGALGIQLQYNAGTPRFYAGDGSNQYVKFDGTNLSFKGTNAELTAAGLFTASNANITGSITATSGTFGGWSLTATTLQDAAGATGISSAVTGGDDVRFWAGNVTPSSAPFKVTEAGVLTASSGTIGGWTLAATTLASGATENTANISLNQSAGTIRVGSTAAAYILIDGANQRIRSSNYVAGPLGSGFTLEPELLEVGNARIRGRLTSVVFEKETLSSVGGTFIISNSDVLAADMTASDASTLTISGATTFNEGDVLRMKDATDDEWMYITDSSSAPTYSVSRDLAASYAANANPTWEKGTAVVSFGSLKWSYGTDFDALSLGALVGQGGWVDSGSSGTTTCAVVDSGTAVNSPPYAAGTNWVEGSTTGAGTVKVKKVLSSAVARGKFSFSIYSPDYSNITSLIVRLLTENGETLEIKAPTEEFYYSDPVNTAGFSVTGGAWTSTSFGFQCYFDNLYIDSTNGIYGRARLAHNNGGTYIWPTETGNWYEAWTTQSSASVPGAVIAIEIEMITTGDSTFDFGDIIPVDMEGNAYIEIQSGSGTIDTYLRGVKRTGALYSDTTTSFMLGALGTITATEEYGLLVKSGASSYEKFRISNENGISIITSDAVAERTLGKINIAPNTGAWYGSPSDVIAWYYPQADWNGIRTQAVPRAVMSFGMDSGTKYQSLVVATNLDADSDYYRARANYGVYGYSGGYSTSGGANAVMETSVVYTDGNGTNGTSTITLKSIPLGTGTATITLTAGLIDMSSAVFKPKVFNQATEPSTTNIPSGYAAIWTDTDDSKCYLCYNHGGTVKTVELL